MNWWSTLVTALITLAVTVLGGLIVYYVTSDASAPTSEKLIYTLTTSATFGASPNEISFQELDVSNAGKTSAKNVSISMNFNGGYSVNQKHITLSDDVSSSVIDQSNGSEIKLIVPNLLPTEILKLSVLVNGNGTPVPSVVIHSDESIASPALPQSGHRGEFSEVAQAMLLLLTLLILQLLLLRLIRLSRILPGARGSMNNAAFLFLQQGLLDDAEKMLFNVLSRAGAEPIIIANLALLHGLKGDYEGAAKRFEIAEWWAEGKHEKAVVAFDRAIVAIQRKDIPTSVRELELSFSLSRRHISNYCKLNIYIKEAALQSDEIKQILGSRGRR
jgi:hypothetical protein